MTDPVAEREGAWREMEKVTGSAGDWSACNDVSQSPNQFSLVTTLLSCPRPPLHEHTHLIIPPPPYLSSPSVKDVCGELPLSPEKTTVMSEAHPSGGDDSYPV